MASIDHIVGEVNARLESKNSARDQALIDSRKVIRHAATAIRALHRGEPERAHVDLEAGRAMVATTKQELAGYPDLYWAGYVQDAQKEFAEAAFVASMVQGSNLPAPEELAVEDAPYLNGLAEAASEMRRYVLDLIRKGGSQEVPQAERVLEVMDDVYTCLITVDFPDSITGGLRRTTDALRAVLERTRGDLTITIRQLQLERALQHRA